MSGPPFADSDIAIIGMAGRFPGAPDVDALWERVVAGEDCLVDLHPRDLMARGVVETTLSDPSYVRRAGILHDVARFDAGLFGIGPRDAAVMDPQHRHFLECAWAALESAAVDPSRFKGSIGVFGGSGMNTYLLHCLRSDPGLVDRLGWFLLRHTGNDKDFLSTLVSYKLDLRGPSVNVQTACSTSLVAVHLAVQSLLSMECDVALAGGSTIEVPHGVGYRHLEGEILSEQGRCRAFDAASDGTVLTSGVGVVALRRLAEAWEDGDPILAVIKGTAINNDGSRKVSYLAPSVDGHADVVTEALAVADLSPGDLQLLEAHGTGTGLGDAIEVAALTDAFGPEPEAGTCRLTSTKPNVGHLDTAAGVVSLMKVVQALRHQVLPPMANHTAPSDLIQPGRSPFVVSADASRWPGDVPRRAGISSLGVGGTNAHVIVEEGPPRPELPPTDGPHVVLLSAGCEAALDAMGADLAAHLTAHPVLDAGDVASTIAIGRRSLQYRRGLVAADRADLIDRLGERRSAVVRPAASRPRVVFLFPGGGAQFPGMIANLDSRFDTAHRVFEDIAAEIRSRSGVDLTQLLRTGADPAALAAPTVALPAVFAATVALARQWMEWGVEPDAMIGHSLGEYAAAHLAGVLSMRDAAQLVTVRAELMERVGGAETGMLVVAIPEAEASRFVTPRLSLAVVNAADECVLAGDRSETQRVAAELAARGVETSHIPLAAAAHSALLDPVLDEFRAAVAEVALAPPQRPFVSNVTGTWATESDVTDIEHWVRHLRDTVRFHDGLASVLGDGATVTVEIGPGRALSSTARRAERPPALAVPSLRHPRRSGDDTIHAVQALVDVWSTGVDVDLGVWLPSGRPRVTLPTYPFQGERHWIGHPLPPGADAEETTSLATRRNDESEMWWEPRWQEVSEPRAQEAPRRWWLVSGSRGADGELLAALSERARDVVEVEEPASIGSLEDRDAVVLVVPGVSPADGTCSLTDARAAFDRAAELARLLGASASTGHRLVIVTRGAVGVGAPAADPLASLVRGVALVAPQEYPDLGVLHLDLEPRHPGDRTGGSRQELSVLVAEATCQRSSRAATVLVRGEASLEPDVRPTRPVAAAGSGLAGGAYVVTGGLGGIGHVLAEHLARVQGADLCLIVSRPLPAEDERAEWISTHGPGDAIAVRLRRLREIESFGTSVYVVEADLSRPGSIAVALDEAQRLLGRVDGVVHVAGVLHDQLIETLTPSDVDQVVSTKAGAAVELAEELESRGVSRLVLVSSTSTVLAPPGQSAYVGANAVLDALAGRRGAVRISTLSFGMWSGTGMATEFDLRSRLGVEHGDPVDHPVFEELVRPRRAGQCTEVIGHLHSRHHVVLDDHRDRSGQAVLPGTGHLALMFDALDISEPSDGPRSLQDVEIHEPILVSDGTMPLIRVRIGDLHHDGATRVVVETDGGPSVGWVLHSAAVSVPAEPPGDIDVVLAPEVHVGSLDVFAGQRDHLRLGPSWDVVAEESAVGEHGATARLQASAGAPRVSAQALDAATGLAVQVHRASRSRDGLLVPIGYRRVTSLGPFPSSIHVAVARSSGARDRPEFDLRVDDSLSGQPVLAIDGLELWSLVAGTELGSRPSPPEVRRPESPLVGLAERSGITPSEGTVLFDSFLLDERDHLIASSVDLRALAARVVTTGLGSNSARTPSTESSILDDAPTEELVANLWCGLLDVPSVEPDDDFFDAGGHSLIAIRLISALRRSCGATLRLAEMFDAPTFRELVALVDERRQGTQPASSSSSSDDKVIVPISTDGDGLPFFVIHGAGGGVLFLWSLPRALSVRRPVFGVQAVGTDGNTMADQTVADMADRYAEEIRAVHSGPYLLGGYSGGGLVALEVAARLRSNGGDVRRVVLFDSVPPGCAQPSRLDRARRFWTHIIRGRIRGLGPYVRGLAENGWHWLPLVPPIELVEDHVDLGEHFAEISERHQHGVYDVDVSLIKADLIWPVQPWDYYWNGHLAGAFDVRTTPGDHFTMFTRPHVDVLAAHVDAILSEAERQPGP
jgi:acyl transferase domain-containing protein/thioesterase domain-containing protein/acyl carrier protein